MNHFTKKISVFAILWCFIFSAKAQDNDEAALTAQFNSFIKAYSTVEKTKDKKTVLKYMSKDVRASLTSFDIAQNMEIRNTDYKSFEAHLDDLISKEDLEIKYDVSKILRNYINNNNGVMVYTVDYEIKKNKHPWSKGTETVTLTYKKTEGVWTIIQYSVVAIEDERFRGACLCEVYTDKNGEFVSKLMIPTGRTYLDQLNHFSFYESNGERYIKVETFTYRWAKTGEIWLQGSPNETKIGAAYTNDKKEAMVAILGRHLYVDNCTETKLTKK